MAAKQIVSVELLNADQVAEQAGEILEALEATGLFESVRFVVTGDGVYGQLIADLKKPIVTETITRTRTERT